MASAKALVIKPLARRLSRQASAALHNRRHDIRVILIPDGMTPEADFLETSSWAWLGQVLENASCHAEFWEFHYFWSADSNLSAWAHCYDGGQALYDDLIKFEVTQFQRIPFLFVSNGLGGLILKKAIHCLHEKRLEQHARSLLAKIGQLVFLRCPHPSNKDQQALLHKIMQRDRKTGVNDRAYALSLQDEGIAGSICSNFTGTGIDCRILATYETSSPTRVASIVVPQDLVQSRARGEFLCPLDVECRDMKHLSGDQDDKCRFKALLSDSLSEIRKLGLTSEDTLIDDDPDFGSEGNLFDSTTSLHLLQSTLIGHGPVVESPATYHRPDLRLQVSQYTYPTLPCRVLPSHEGPDWYGRQDVLERLSTALTPDPTAGRSFGSTDMRLYSLCGPGGLGKSRSAARFAQTASAHFDAIMWIQADSKTSIDQSFAHVANEFGFATMAGPGHLAASFTAVMNWLRNPRKRPSQSSSSSGPQMALPASWLLIYDNVIDFELLKEYFPSAAPGSVLVTSREEDGIAFCQKYGGRGEVLQRMSIEDSERLVMSILPPSTKSQIQEQEIRSLLEKAAGVPIAIVRYASVVSSGHVDIHNLLLQWDAEIGKLSADDPRLPPTDSRYPHSLFTLWELEKISRPTRGLLNIMSFFRPFDISIDMLTISDKLSDDVPYPRFQMAFQKALEELSELALISFKNKEKALELHPLLQDIIVTRLVTRPRLMLYYEAAIVITDGAWPEEAEKWSHDWNTLMAARPLVGHVQQLLDYYHKYDRLRTVGPRTLPHWINLLIKFGWYLYQRSEYDAALEKAMLARTLAQGTPHKEALADCQMLELIIRPHMVDARTLFKLAAGHLSARQALTCGTDAARLAHEALGLTALAGIMNDASKFHDGLRLANDAIALYRRARKMSSEDRLPLLPVQHKCWALWSMGRCQEALEVLLATLDQTYYPRSEGRSYTYWQAGLYLIRGNVQQSAGQHYDSWLSYRNALKLFQLYNGDGIRTAVVHQRLANYFAYHDTRQPRPGYSSSAAKAWKHFEEALRLFQQNKHYRAELARCQIEAARFLKREQRDTDRAEQLLIDAGGILYYLGDDRNPESLDEHDLNALVKLSARSGRPWEARSCPAMPHRVIAMDVTEAEWSKRGLLQKGVRVSGMVLLAALILIACWVL